MGASRIRHQERGPGAPAGTRCAPPRPDRPYVPPTTAGVLVSDRSPVGPPAVGSKERTSLLWWFQSMSKASVARRMGVSVHTGAMYIKRARVKYAQVGRAAPTKADMLARAIEEQLLVTPAEVANSTLRTPPR